MSVARTNNMNDLCTVSFEHFYQSMGFSKYPFREKTAEREDIQKLFVKPLNYSILSDDLSSDISTIVCGNRGTGKTMLLSDLVNNVDPNRVNCFIDNFESVAKSNNQFDFYSIILKTLTKSTLAFLSSHKKLLKSANKEDKILLSFLIKKYSDEITDSQLYTAIESVQLSRFKRLINKVSKPLTTLVNYGSTAVTNLGNEFLTKHFGPYLPDVDENTIKKIFPDISFPVEKQFHTLPISYDLFNRSIKAIRRITKSIPLVFVDKLDEDPRLENDSEMVADFIKGLICDNKLLLNQDLQLIVAVWEIPFEHLSTVFRKSKNSVYAIDWGKNQLELVLNHRLYVYSERRINNFKDLFNEDISTEEIDLIYTLANRNPRDLWTIFDAIFNAQYMLNCRSTKISKEAILDGLRTFVSKFQFYEYYPRKKNAQRNTNDVYSYINYLLKLHGTDEFTNSELRESASTGGSTTNYISGMLKIGLVKKTEKKRPGGAVIYKVNDPKVTYAIMNGIDICTG